MPTEGSLVGMCIKLSNVAVVEEIVLADLREDSAFLDSVSIDGATG